MISFSPWHSTFAHCGKASKCILYSDGIRYKSVKRNLQIQDEQKRQSLPHSAIAFAEQMQSSPTTENERLQCQHAKYPGICEPYIVQFAVVVGFYPASKTIFLLWDVERNCRVPIR